MQIAYDYRVIKDFATMFFSHDFKAYAHLFSYRKFEIPNLSDDVKEAFLTKLNVSNPEGVCSFQAFWSWVQTNYGDDLAKQFCEHNFASVPEAHRHLFMMIENPHHPDWIHIQARCYRKWCSIVTEAQCTYAVLRGIEKKRLDWRVLSSPEMDGYGIDLAVVTPDCAVPIQIKKNTTSAYARDKHNHLANLSRLHLSAKAAGVLRRDLNRYCPLLRGQSAYQSDLLILKYGLPDRSTRQLPYDYLMASPNNFIYFDGEKTVSSLEQALHAA